MARCSFFSVEVLWFEEEWFLDVPDKDKEPVGFLDFILCGLIMCRYDIDTYKGHKKTPEELKEMGFSITLAVPQRKLSYRNISQASGWRKPKIVKFLNELLKYGVIFFHETDKKHIKVTHLKAYDRLTDRQKGYLSRQGITAKTIQLEKIKAEHISEANNKLTGDDSPPKGERITPDNKQLKLENIKKSTIDYIEYDDMKNIYYNHFQELSNEQKTLVRERCFKLGIKSKNFMAL